MIGRTRERIKLNTVAITLVLVMFFCSLYSDKVNAATRTLTIDQAMAMGLKVSDEYSTTNSKLLLAKVQYTQSVKKLKLKQKNQKRLRWSPLLNFKLPEKPDLADEIDYNYKPMELQSKIDITNHKLNNVKYGVYEKVGIEFCKVYELQQTIAFTEDRIKSAEKGLQKNMARLKLGEATQADVDSLQASLDKLKDSLATSLRNFETEKRKLGDLIGTDVTTNYRFASPFIDVEITEQMLPDLINYTVDNDHNFYETSVATNNALLVLDTDYSLMKNQYGGKMTLIDSFVNQAKRGEKLDNAAFKLKYDELLEKVDERWRGNYKILFIKFSKDFMKGSIDGVNYVEDEPYALYTAACDYQQQLSEKISAEKELRSTVDSTFRNYISTRLAVAQTKDNITKLGNDLAKYKSLNAAGKMTFEEYSAALEEYEEEQLGLIKSQSEYSQLLYSFDSLTCGAINMLMNGKGTFMSSASQGSSYVVEDEGDGVYYYIRSLVSDNVFELGLSVSEDFEGSITDYELFIGDEQIGGKTPIEKAIRHLSFDLDEVEGSVKIRLWDGPDFIDDCVIDPSVSSAKLSVTLSRKIETNEVTKVADYVLETGALSEMTSLRIVPVPGEMIASFNIKNADGVYLLSSEKTPVNSTFNYLGITNKDLENLTICFYDDSDGLLYEGVFRTSDSTIHKKE